MKFCKFFNMWCVDIEFEECDCPFDASDVKDCDKCENAKQGTLVL